MYLCGWLWCSLWCILCGEVWCNLCGYQTIPLQLLESMPNCVYSHATFPCQVPQALRVCVSAGVQPTRYVKIEDPGIDILVARATRYVANYDVLIHAAKGYDCGQYQVYDTRTPCVHRQHQ